MKTITSKCFCLNLNLYKIGLLIGVIYIILNLQIIWSIFSTDDDEYAVVLLCSLTVTTSIILIYGLIQNRHTLLVPWLSNVAVLILFNISAVIGQFEEANRIATKETFYLAFGFFITLEVQVLFWYIIFTLLRVGHRKTFRVVELVPENPSSKRIETTDTFKVYLVGTDVLNKTEKV